MSYNKETRMTKYPVKDDFRNKTLNYKIDVEMNHTILKIERM